MIFLQISVIFNNSLEKRHKMDESLIKQLIEELGDDKVSVNKDLLNELSEDMTEIDGHKPDCIVTPECKDDILKVIGFANKYKIALTPVIANTNIGGLAIPNKGGIILNLKKMNRIVEVNEEDMYAVLEPGVTFGQLKEYLDGHHPSLRFGYPLSPPYTSVVANCLLDGLGNLSLAHGSMSSWVNGMEVALASGELLKTGSGAYTKFWYSRSPLPDLSGLFINFQGTTGIVTQMSVQLWPKKKYRKRLFILGYEIDGTYSLIKKLAVEDLYDDIGGLSWPLGKMLFGVKYPKSKDSHEPMLFVFIDISSNYEEEMSFKLDVIYKKVSEFRQKGVPLDDPFDIDVLVRLNPAFTKFTEMPTTLDFLLDHGGGGLTWVGTYGPMSQWEKGIKKGISILEGMGFPPVMVSRPMNGGHFVVLRFIILFNKKDNGEVQKVREVNGILCRSLLELGFIPYKTPPWVVEMMRNNLDPVFRNWTQEVRKLFDPNGIMNPGKWDC